ncbi:PilZ domain-containing protein [Magnetococcales bacterium HHB-1]
MARSSTIYDSLKILDILKIAYDEKNIVEVRWEGEPQVFGSRLIYVPGVEQPEKKKLEDEDDEDFLKLYASQLTERLQPPAKTVEEEIQPENLFLTLAPLEPYEAGKAIKRQAQFSIFFQAGIRTFDAKVAYMQMEPRNFGASVRCSFPRTIWLVQKRQQPRVRVPKKYNIPVRLHKRGEKTYDSRMLDLSSGGAAVYCPEDSCKLKKDDRITVVMGGGDENITVIGSVAYIMKVRSPVDLDKVIDIFGIQFQMISVTAGMAIDRLVKTMQAIALQAKKQK